MNVKLLTGKKIAVLVESQYIPGEIEAYRYGFGILEAEVHFMSRLWGNDSLSFVSEMEQTGHTLLTLEVDIDLEKVNVDDYAAVIMVANYPSVRLRYFEPPAGQLVTPDMVRSAPAPCEISASSRAHCAMAYGFSRPTRNY